MILKERSVCPEFPPAACEGLRKSHPDRCLSILFSICIISINSSCESLRYVFHMRDRVYLQHFAKDDYPVSYHDLFCSPRDKK